VLKRKTDEEKAALNAQRELERAQADKERERQRQAKEQARREREFLASPAGQARTAFERGDRLFQCSFDVKNTTPVVVAMVGATTSGSTSDPTVILNSICTEGWELVNASFVFEELGSVSRDKFMSSGQNVAVRGTIIGYYVFRRSEANRSVT
jgi:hypothetical protein